MSKDQELQKKVQISYDTPKSGSWKTVTDAELEAAAKDKDKEKGKKSQVFVVNYATGDSGTWDVWD